MFYVPAARPPPSVFIDPIRLSTRHPVKLEPGRAPRFFALDSRRRDAARLLDLGL